MGYSIIFVGEAKMRLRNVKGKEEIINNSEYIVKNPSEYKGQWKNLFSNNNEIYIEIGMGKGKFIIENAIKYPNINFIGIEKYDSVMVRAIEKLNDKKLDNLKLIVFNAGKIDEIFDKEITRIYLNFSDPWPKKRHVHRRLTSVEFLKLYDKIFTCDKEIIMKTDNKGLFAYSIESLSKYGYVLDNVTLDLQDDDDNIKTEYEEKFRNKEITINRLEARKK